MLIRISSEDCLLQNWHFFKYLITFRMWWFNGWKMLMKDYFKILLKKWNVFNISKYQAVIIWNIWKSWNERNNLWFEIVNLRQYKSGFKKRGEFRNTLECIKVKKYPNLQQIFFLWNLKFSLCSWYICICKKIKMKMFMHKNKRFNIELLFVK